jgi:hypothetical protein
MTLPMRYVMPIICENWSLPGGRIKIARTDIIKTDSLTLS